MASTGYNLAWMMMFRRCGGETVAKHRFVAWGQRNPIEGMQPVIRAEVEREFAEQYQQATTKAERRGIKRQIEAEIRSRLDRVAPSNGLY